MIGIELKKFQSRCVDYLFERTTSSLNYPKLLVESPTGSGKNYNSYSLYREVFIILS